MTRVALEEAQSNLTDLIARACSGEEIVIETKGRDVALVPGPAPKPRAPRKLGLDPDLFVFHDGWDDPMTEDELAAWLGTDLDRPPR